MRRTASILVLISLALPLLSQAAPAGDLVEKVAHGKKVAGQYIVVLKENVNVDGAADELSRKHNGRALQVYKHALNGFAIALSDDKVKDLENDPRVALVSPDYEVSIVGKTVNAQAQTLPTGIDRINAENKVNKGVGVEVAVIDTGIDSSHPDLKLNIRGGKSCVGGNYNDQNGHGTHVAGTIAALDNTAGVVGVAPQAGLWAVRVLNAQGSGTWSQVICGIDWVTSQSSRIKVANMSLGGGGTAGASCDSDVLHKAICNSVAKGVTYVVAAGNDGADLKNFVPAAYPEVIAATALADSNGKPCGGGSTTSYGADDTFATFSNYATLPQDTVRTIGAPGVSILSTWKGRGYATISGTSMATPHVSGAAALYISTHPGATPTQVRDALIAAGEAAGANVNGECVSGTSHVSSALHLEPVLRADTF